MNNFTYDMSWQDIEDKLNECIKKRNFHFETLKKCPKSMRLYHMRQYKGLEGAITALKWVLGDERYEPLEGLKQTEHV